MISDDDHEAPSTSQPNPTSSTQFTLQRKVMLIAAILGCTATFLPWIKVPIVGSVSGTRGDGWVTLVLFLPAIWVSQRGDRSSRITTGKYLVAALSAMAAALIGFAKIESFNEISSKLRADDNPFTGMFAAGVQLEVGIYVLIGAGLAVAILPPLIAPPVSNSKLEKRGFTKRRTTAGSESRGTSTPSNDRTARLDGVVAGFFGLAGRLCRRVIGSIVVPFRLLNAVLARIAGDDAFMLKFFQIVVYGILLASVAYALR